MKMKIVAYLFIFILALLPAIYLNNIYGYVPFMFIFFLSMISLVYTVLLKKSLEHIELSEVAKCERGKELDFSVNLNNRSFLVFPKIEAVFFIYDLFGNEASTEKVVFTLSSFENKDLRFSVKFDHVGSYKSGLKQIRVFGLFGIFSLVIKNDKFFEVNVTPKIYNFSSLSISDYTYTENNASFASSMLNGSDYTSVREYEIGDSIKNIHWNLSARGMNYMTKQFEKYSSSGITVIMDLQSPEYDNETLMDVFDSIVETALSIAHHAKKTGYKYEIAYMKDDIKKIYAPPHFYQLSGFISDLPQITVSNQFYDVKELLKEQCRNTKEMETVVLCTSNVTNDIISILVAIKKCLKNPILYFILPENGEGKEKNDSIHLLSILEENHIEYSIISSASDLRKAG